LAQQHTIGLLLRDAEGGRVDPKNPAAPLYLQVSPGYFETMGIPRLRGRDIAATDDSTTAAAVINKTMADALWPNQNPIGRHFTVGDTRTVVGVVGDVRSHRLDEKAEMQMYLPQADHAGKDFNLIVRGTLTPEAMGARIRDAVRSVDQAQAVYNVRSMNDVVSTSVAPRRTNTVLLVIFGTIAAMLAAIGVYAVLAYGVAQRTREIGVRLALGAQRGDVMRLVVAHGAVLAAIGATIGLAGAYALARLIESFLYEVRIHDLRIFVGAPVLLATIALAATIIPAWRASRVDPVVALRQE
jgi:predicted permease